MMRSAFDLTRRSIRLGDWKYEVVAFSEYNVFSMLVLFLCNWYPYILRQMLLEKNILGPTIILF